MLTRGARAGVLSDASSKPLFIVGGSGERNAWLASARSMMLDEALLIDAAGTVHLTAAMQKRLKFTEQNTVVQVAQ